MTNTPEKNDFPIMSHTLVSLLGGSSQLEPAKRYRPACYDFGNGEKLTGQYFGLALTEHIKPDKLIILGTSGSMWDVLLDSLGLMDNYETECYALVESAAQDGITQRQLDDLSELASKELPCQVSLCLIPYGRNIQEQVQILTRMAQDLVPGEQVSLDVTHGLRHLPLLMQMSALYLRETQRVNITGVYYGALDMTRNGITPVMRLDGWLEMADWVEAIHSFERDGDYGVFAPLIKNAMPEQAGLLEEAAFQERMFQVGSARSKLKKFLAKLQDNPLTGAAALFQPKLEEHIGWCRQQQKLYQRQEQLARNYLRNDDFLRCAIFAYEGFITRLCQDQNIQDVDNPAAREKVKEDYEEKLGKHHAYYDLRRIRNQLAHANRENVGKWRSVMQNKEKLRAELQQAIDELFG